MAKNDQFDKEELFTVDAPDVDGADAWDDWDDMDVDVAPSDAASSQEEAPSFDAEEAPQSAAAPAAESADEPAEVAAIAEPASSEATAEPVEASVSDAPITYEVADASEEWGDDDWGEDEAATAEDDFNEFDISDEELAEYLPPEPAVQPEAPAEEPVEETVSAEEQEAAVDEALAQPEVEKSAEEIQREQEELEAYRSAMGESNAEMADVSEYRTFRKKTKTESKSNVPKKSDFDLFANRYKVRTMNAMVAAADPIVYFYNACLRTDGTILAFNVYQVLQDRFIGKMVPQLFTAVAENSNKIEDLNEANLIEQLKVCAEFPQYDFIISVSARFFTKPALLERFLRLVPEGGVPNLVFAFDCTSLESIAIAAKAGLGAVRQRGVKILLDNTEKVTMTVLSEFDYDYIRIDSRYYEIGNPRAEAYLRLLLSLTKEQNVSTIASFCDTEDLSEYMFFMGVDAVQGNAVSRPMRTVPNSVKGITLLPSMLDA